MNFADKTAVFLATGFYIGRIPLAPGTFGSLAGLPLCFLLAEIQMAAAIVAILLFIALATWIAGAAGRALGHPDPGCIVIDEIAGMMITLMGLPFKPTTVAAGFILFRILDIVKPYPIRVLDQRLPGGVGIVADDVIAGIFANFVLRILIYISII